MSLDRREERRHAGRRQFRPRLEDGLESRFLLSHYLPASAFLKNTKPGLAYIHGQPPFRKGSNAHEFPIAHFPRGPHIATETAHGGMSVIIATPDGSHFTAQITQFIPT